MAVNQRLRNDKAPGSVIHMASDSREGEPAGVGRDRNRGPQTQGILKEVIIARQGGRGKKLGPCHSTNGIGD